MMGFMLSDHEHVIYGDDERCITCWLRKETWTELDKLNATHTPYSKWCSNCGATITKDEDFENFALARFDSLHTTCEKCIKKYHLSRN